MTSRDEDQLITSVLHRLDQAWAPLVREGDVRGLIVAGLRAVQDDPQMIRALVLLALRQEAWAAIESGKGPVARLEREATMARVRAELQREDDLQLERLTA